MNTDEIAKSKTKHKLLESAGQVFADKGYSRSTIREICDRAGTNVASVNYYFRDKEELYRSVFDYAHKRVGEHILHAVGTIPDATPEEKLRTFVRAHLHSLLGTDGPPSWFSTLVSREMIEPTHLQREMVEREIRPRSDLLIGILREMLGPRATEEQLRHCSLSVVSQSVFHKLAAPVIRTLHPEQTYTAEDLDRLAIHIAGFSLAGIQSLREQLEVNRK